VLTAWWGCSNALQDQFSTLNRANVIPDHWQSLSLKSVLRRISLPPFRSGRLDSADSLTLISFPWFCGEVPEKPADCTRGYFCHRGPFSRSMPLEITILFIYAPCVSWGIGAYPCHPLIDILYITVHQRKFRIPTHTHLRHVRHIRRRSHGHQGQRSSSCFGVRFLSFSCSHYTNCSGFVKAKMILGLCFFRSL